MRNEDYDYESVSYFNFIILLKIMLVIITMFYLILRVNRF